MHSIFLPSSIPVSKDPAKKKSIIKELLDDSTLDLSAKFRFEKGISSLTIARITTAPRKADDVPAIKISNSPQPTKRSGSGLGFLQSIINSIQNILYHLKSDFSIPSFPNQSDEDDFRLYLRRHLRRRMVILLTISCVFSIMNIILYTFAMSQGYQYVRIGMESIITTVFLVSLFVIFRVPSLSHHLENLVMMVIFVVLLVAASWDYYLHMYYPEDIVGSEVRGYFCYIVEIK
jgi:hypothetical protein